MKNPGHRRPVANKNRPVANKNNGSLAPVFWAVGILGSLIFVGLIVIVVLLVNGNGGQQEQVADQNPPNNSRPIRNQGEQKPVDRNSDPIVEQQKPVKEESAPVQKAPVQNLPKVNPKAEDDIPITPPEYNISWAGEEMEFEIVPAKFGTKSKLGGRGRYLILEDTDSFDIFDVQEEMVLLTVDMEPNTELGVNQTKVVGYHHDSRKLTRWDLETGRLEQQKTLDLPESNLSFRPTPYAEVNFILTDGKVVYDINTNTLHCSKIDFEFKKFHVAKDGGRIMREGFISIWRPSTGVWKEMRGSVNPEGIDIVSASNTYFVDKVGVYHRGEPYRLRFDGVYSVIPAESDLYYLQWPDPDVGDQRETHYPIMRYFQANHGRIKMDFLGAKTLSRYLIPEQNKIVEVIPGGVRCLPIVFRGLFNRRWDPDEIYAAHDPRTEEIKKAEAEFQPYDLEIVNGKFKLPYPYTETFFSQGDTRICFYHPVQQLISILDTEKFEMIASIPVPRDIEITTNRSVLFVFDRENKRVDKWSTESGKHAFSRDWNTEFPDEVISGGNGGGPILARFDPPAGERTYRFELLDQAGLDRGQFFKQEVAFGKTKDIPWELSINEDYPPALFVSGRGTRFAVGTSYTIGANRYKAGWSFSPGIGIPLDESGTWINHLGTVRWDRRSGKYVAKPGLENARVVAPPYGSLYLVYKVPGSLGKRTRSEREESIGRIQKFMIKDLAVFGATSRSNPTALLEGVNIETDRRDLNDMSDRLFLLPKKRIVLSSNLEKDELQIHLLPDAKQVLNREGTKKTAAEELLSMEADSKPAESNPQPKPSYENTGINGPRFTVLKTAEESQLIRTDPKIFSVKMPAKMTNCSVGGAGRYIAMHFEELGKVAVFDVASNRVKGYIDVGNTPIRLAAGLEKLLILQTKKGLLAKWDLESMQVEAVKRMRNEWGNDGLHLGSCSQGPAILSPGRMLDLSSLGTSEIKVKGPIRFPVFNEKIRLTVDGKHLASSSLLFSHDGGTNWKRSEETLHNVQIYRAKYPVAIQRIFDFKYDWDRKIFFSNSSVLFNCYVNKINQIGVYGVGKPRTFDLLSTTRISPSNRNIAFVPSLNKLIVFGRENVMNIISLDIAAEINKQSFQKLYVYSNPFPAVRPGEQFSYQLHATSARPNTSYKLKSAPSGMSVSDQGLITWTVPSSFQDPVNVTVNVQGNGSDDHEFTLVPRMQVSTKEVDSYLLKRFEGG